MTEILQTELQKNPGIYSLYILNNNQPAKTFWKQAFKKAGYEETPLEPEGSFDFELGKTYGFQKVTEEATK